MKNYKILFLIIFLILFLSVIITRFGAIHYQRGNFDEFGIETLGKMNQSIYDILIFPTYNILYYGLNVHIKGGGLFYWSIIIFNSLFQSLVFTGLIVFIRTKFKKT